MKILVSGANGQLGQDIVHFCKKCNHTVIAADSKSLDITNKSLTDNFIKIHAPDIIINCAAYNAVDLAEKEWKRAFAVNGLGVKNLALAANNQNAILVHYSTDYVFDGMSKRPYTILDLPNPISRYGESKLLGENVVRDLCDRYFLIRTSWIFGKGNSNFARKILEWSRDKTELSVVDDQVSSPTYTADLARASLDLILTGSFGLYHCTNAGYCSRYEWADYILQQTGWKGRLIRAKSVDFKSPAQRPEFSVLDNFGAEETLGYSLPAWQDATKRFLHEIRGA
jgi:dTDP-4-dehydrorhamnose reductase